MQKRKEPEADEMQVVCDSYNLHLTSGFQDNNLPTREEVSEAMDEAYLATMTGETIKAKIGSTEDFTSKRIVWPDDNERSRIRKFFNRYCRPVASEKGEYGSLIWYECTTGKSWFESNDYLGFVVHWRNLRRLLDNILDRPDEMPVDLLRWFSENAIRWWTEDLRHRKGYIPFVALEDPDKKPVSLDDVNAETISLKAWKVVEDSSIELIRYGINIGYLLYVIHRLFIQAMNNPQVLRRCQAEATPKRSDCQNIFLLGIGGRNKDYCSTRCRKRDYMAKKRTRNQR